MDARGGIVANGGVCRGAYVGGLLGGCWDRGEAFSNTTIT